MGDEQKVADKVPVPGGIVEPPRPDRDGAGKPQRAGEASVEYGMTLFDWLYRTFPGKALFALVGLLLVLSISMVVLALLGGRVIEIGPIKFGNPVIVDETAIAKVNKRLEQAEVENLRLTEQVERLRERIGADEARTTDQFNNSGTRTAALEGRQSGTENRLTRMESNVTGQATRIANAEGALTTHTGQISTLSGSVTEATNRLSTVEGTVNGMGAAISGVATKVTQSEGRIAEIEGRATTLDAQLQSVRGAITQHGRDLETLRGDVEGLKADRVPPPQATGETIR